MTDIRDDFEAVLDRIRDETRAAVLEGDAKDCSSADCIADAVWEICRVALRGLTVVREGGVGRPAKRRPAASRELAEDHSGADGRPSHPPARGTVMSEPLTDPILDASCYCPKCRARTSEMYDLRGACTNCGQTFTVRARKGDSAPLSVECPACEVTVYG